MAGVPISALVAFRRGIVIFITILWFSSNKDVISEWQGRGRTIALPDAHKDGKKFDLFKCYDRFDGAIDFLPN